MDNYIFRKYLNKCTYVPEDTRYIEIFNYSVRFPLLFSPFHHLGNSFRSVFCLFDPRAPCGFVLPTATFGSSRPLWRVWYPPVPPAAGNFTWHSPTGHCCG